MCLIWSNHYCKTYKAVLYIEYITRIIDNVLPMLKNMRMLVKDAAHPLSRCQTYLIQAHPVAGSSGYLVNFCQTWGHVT